MSKNRCEITMIWNNYLKDFGRLGKRSSSTFGEELLDWLSKAEFNCETKHKEWHFISLCCKDVVLVFREECE